MAKNKLRIRGHRVCPKCQRRLRRAGKGLESLNVQKWVWMARRRVWIPLGVVQRASDGDTVGFGEGISGQERNLDCQGKGLDF